VSFQNGVNGYTGTFDRKIDERGGTNDQDGSTVAQYFLDGYQADPVSPDAQALIRFDNIIGGGAGQIPAGATILSAQLTVNTSTTGNAQSAGPWGVAQLLGPFDSSTTYFGSYNCGGCALVSRGPWWQDSYTERPLAGYGGKWQGDIAVADITPIVQNWVSGAANHGVTIQTGNPPGTVDGWGVISTGHPVIERRPQLSVTYTTDPVEINTFQRGLNNYTSDTLAYVKSGTNIFGTTTEPDSGRDDITYDGAAGTFTLAPNTIITDAVPLAQFQQFLDGPQFPDTTGVANSVDDFALFKFGNVFGSGADQAPTDVPVAKAWLALTTGDLSDNSPSNGEWAVHRMLRSWDATSLHSSFGSTPGLQVFDGDIDPALDTQIGIIFGSDVLFDVTSYVEGVRNGQPDNGLAVLSTATADGWQIHLNGSDQPEFRPRLVIASGNPAVVGLEGDYNGDGTVDAADYVVWRKTDGSPSGYNTWRTNFDRTAGGGGPLGSGAGQAAVPEPSAWLLGLLACVAPGIARRRNQ
jgi:hypothetical protein